MNIENKIDIYDTSFIVTEQRKELLQSNNDLIKVLEKIIVGSLEIVSYFNSCSFFSSLSKKNNNSILTYNCIHDINE